MLSGMAVDVMRHEQRRSQIQTTLDSALLAAASIHQSRDSKEVVNEYLAKAGIDPSLVQVQERRETLDGVTLTGRAVAATYEFSTDTIFMGILGIEELEGAAYGSAQEGSSMIEIALVLDISDSMNENGRLERLKSAAKDFVALVLENNDPDRVTISIIPYNHQVYMPDHLVEAFSDLGLLESWGNYFDAPHRPGEIVTLDYTDPESRCFHFWEEDWETRQVAPRGNMTMSAVFVDDKFTHNYNGMTNVPFEPPQEFSFWCNDFNSQLLLYENDLTSLNRFIDALFATEGTAIDNAMKWGAMVLDPSMQPVVENLISGGHLPERMSGFPAEYDRSDVQKVVVLMSDGMNDHRMDLEWFLKAERSPVWFSEQLANAASDEFMGFMVEFPDNDPSERWYLPGRPETLADDRFISDAGLPGDQVQWSYPDVYKRFTTNDAAVYFFQNSGDSDAFVYHLNVVTETNYWWMDNYTTPLVCWSAKLNNEVTVFTVAFEAPDEGVEVLRNCATTPGHFFDVDGQEIVDAFASIALQLSVLKLTN